MRCSGTFCCTEVNIFCGGGLGCKYLVAKTQHQGCLRAADGKYVSRSTFLYLLSLYFGTVTRWNPSLTKRRPQTGLFFWLENSASLSFNCTHLPDTVWLLLLRIPDVQWTTRRPGSGREWGDIMERAVTSAGSRRHHPSLWLRHFARTVEACWDGALSKIC